MASVEAPLQSNSLPLEGGCACGAVRFSLTGKPKRAGLCHCLTCRKAHAAAFNPFLVFDRRQVNVNGPIAGWMSSENYDRRFCPRCGSRVMGVSRDEVEISLGSLDRAGLIFPEYELWVGRREPWLAALSVPQYQENRE